MALPNLYPDQNCPLARSLEVIGERWTLLILRDAFFGVRRFGDFVTRLQIPRAVLTERLKSLTAAGILERVPGNGRREEYLLTDRGIALWPALRALMSWGDEFYFPDGPVRVFRHAVDDGMLDLAGNCAICGAEPGPADTVVAPGPGDHSGPVQAFPSLGVPHHLLEPVRG